MSSGLSCKSYNFMKMQWWISGVFEIDTRRQLSPLDVSIILLFSSSDFMRSLISDMDFRSLEVRLFKAKVNLSELLLTNMFMFWICFHEAQSITCMQHQIHSHISHIQATNSTSLSWHRGYNYNEINTGKYFEEQFQSMLCKASFFFFF